MASNDALWLMILTAIAVVGVVLVAAFCAYDSWHKGCEIAELRELLLAHRHQPAGPGVPSSHWGTVIFRVASDERASSSPPVQVLPPGGSVPSADRADTLLASEPITTMPSAGVVTPSAKTADVPS